MRIYVVTSRCGCLMDPPSCYKSKVDAEKAVRKMVLVVLRDMIDEAITNDGIEDEVDFNIAKDNDKLLVFAVEHEYATSYNCKDSQGNDIIDTITIGDEWTEFRIDACNVKEKSKAKPKKKKVPAKKQKKDIRQEIYEYLDACFACGDYNQAVEDVAEKWHISKDDAENHVWNWTTRNRVNY